MIRTLLILLMPAALLCVIVMAVASYVGAATRGDKKAIHAGTIRSLPYALILNHAIVFAVLLIVMRAQALNPRALGLTLGPGTRLLSEIGLGLAAGLLIYCIDRFFLTPLGERAQERFGGYRVDQGDHGQANRIAWLLAVVVFAAVVEESVYRGYALHQLTPLAGAAWAVIISSILFGLLHWAYGWWGMLATVVIGALFALLFLWRQSLVAPVIAHGLHNLINTLIKQKVRR